MSKPTALAAVIRARPKTPKTPKKLKKLPLPPSAEPGLVSVDKSGAALPGATHSHEGKLSRLFALQDAGFTPELLRAAVKRLEGLLLSVDEEVQLRAAKEIIGMLPKDSVNAVAPSGPMRLDITIRRFGAPRTVVDVTPIAAPAAPSVLASSETC